MYQVEYYKRPNGHEPAKEWINEQDRSIVPSIHVWIDRLKKEGLSLLDNKILEPIREKPGGKIIPNFFELRHLGKIKWRIPVYYDDKRNIFILISEGWRKTKKVQQKDVDKAINLLNEYLFE